MMILADTLEGFRLSPQQLRWARLRPGAAPPHMTGFTRVRGPIDVQKLSAAWLELQDQYEILRTCIAYRPGSAELLQVVADRPLSPLLRRQLTPATSISQALLDAAQEPFLLDQGPLARLTVLDIGSGENGLLWSLSGYVADRASLPLLAAELFKIYQSPRSHAALSAPPTQYADAAEWLRECDPVDDPTPVSSAPLPFENRPPSFAPFPELVAVQSASLRPDLCAKLRAHCASRPASVAPTLLAVWTTLLFRITQQPEFSVCLVANPRSEPELANVIGPLEVDRVLSLHIRGDQPFHEWSASLERIWTAAAQEPGVSDSPAATEELCHFEFTAAPPLPHGAVWEHLRSTGAPGKLKLALVDRGESLGLEWLFDSARFAAADIARLAGQFEVLLDSALLNPAAPLHTLDLISPADLQSLLIEFNSGPVVTPPDTCIHHLIEQQARRTPEAIAAICSGTSLTYAQLDARAAALARRLVALGAGPDIPIGLCLQRSTELIVAILGVLKAGAAYLPLDPTYPPDRLAFMLEDARAPILVSHRAVASLPPTSAHLLWLNAAGALDESLPNPRILPPPRPLPDHPQLESSHLAYIIYTSGSTGKPKGVPISHRNLVHSTWARMQYYPEPVQRYLLLSSYSFDSSVAGIFWTLCQGGALVLPEEKAQRDPFELAALIAAHSISHLLSLPSLYRPLLEQSQPGQLASLRTVIVAGESCPLDLIDRHRAGLPQAGLFNEYGPTEGTVWSSVFNCLDPIRGRQVPIGKPLPNVQLYVLDPQRRPVPIWTSGELYISGDGLARGYLNRPDLTAQKFVAHPFSSDPHARLYRTGDLARWLPDGNLEFLGRADQQVKIRGYRIELEEIEAALLTLPEVRQALVAAREDTPGEPRLVAYLSAPAPLALPQLREQLRSLLPEFMIPAAWVQLPALPTNPNGKIDRNALPAPESASSAHGPADPPANPSEELVASVWRNVLRLQDVNRFDNFFLLGGHSLLAIQVVARLREALHCEIPVRLVFEAPVLADFAVKLGELPQQTAETAAAPIPRARRTAVDAFDYSP